MTVELAVVPHEQQHLIVIGTTVRKPANILRPYLQSLAWQVAPPQVQRLYLFIDDGCDAEARSLLDGFVVEHGGMVWNAEPAPAGDFQDQGFTHLWTESAMARVGRSKDKIIQFAIANRAEAVWFADADLIMDPMTLASLWSVPEPIVCAVYWTRWNKVPDDHPPVHAGPQVWLTHPYGLSGMGMEEWEFRKELVDRQVTEVRGHGACTLIRRSALMKGVSFAPWPGNKMEGIGQGEDRHFCMRAEALHLRMVADPWPDIFHVYHRPEDEERIGEMLQRIEQGWGDGSPAIGDLVSLDLTALEPILTHQGPMQPPAQQVRGRLGQLPLHPELESAVLEMQRGETRIVPVHFPNSWSFPPYRGQRRLIRVRLIDHKPFGFPPVIEDEILTTPSGGWIDQTQCPPELIDAIQEVSAG